MSELKVVVGSVNTDPSSFVGFTHHDSKFERKTRFVNHSTSTLFICSPDGSIIQMKPSTGQGFREALIIIHETYPHSSELKWIEGSECHHLRDIRLAALKTGRSEWEEVVPIKEISEHRHGVYLRLHDVVVTTDYIWAFQTHHPRCKQKIHNDYVAAMKELQPDNMIGVLIRLVDNSGKTGVRYTVFHDMVQKLTPVIEPEMDDGIYITGLVEIDAHGNRTTRTDRHYSFEQVANGEAPIQLFDSIIEANQNKDSLVKKELELRDAISKREHEQQLADSKKEHERVKLELERRSMEAEQRLKDRQWELDNLKAERDDMLHRSKHHRTMESESYGLQIAAIKANQEKISSDQKTFVEGIKTVGLLITAGLTLKAFLK